MANLEKTSEQLSNVEQASGQINVGDIFFSLLHECIIRITGVKPDQGINDDPSYFYDDLESMTPETWSEGIVYSNGQSRKSTISKESLENHYAKIETAIFNKMIGRVENYILTGDLSEYQLNEYRNLDSSTAIVAPGSKEHLSTMHSAIEAKKQEVETLQLLINAKLAIEKAKMNELRSQLEGQIKIFQKQMRRIMRVINTIELYLGIEEDLVQIMEGQPAPADYPICFRQQILFMDEEIGVWTNGGFDFTNIPDFENWLLTDSNFKKLLPEEKGMVVFKPRRNSKEYGTEYDDEINENNKQTYFLIRNGDNLYRISSEKIQIPDRLFPLKEELQTLFNELQHIMTTKKHVWGSDKKKKEEEVENKTFRYKQLAFLMQGLIDRTEIFSPFAKKINVFDLTNNQDAVNFIYDDELALPTGRKLFKDWQRELNSKITRGSRVLLTGLYNPNRGYTSLEEFRDRLFYYVSKHNAPSLPDSGIYEVESRWQQEKEELVHYEMERIDGEGCLIKKGKQVYRFLKGWETHEFHAKPLPGVQIRYVENPAEERRSLYIEAYECVYKYQQLYIKHNPGGETSHGWGNWGHERKNRIGWKIYQSDRFVINYDLVTLEDIEFYLYSRIDRQNYLYMLPVLYNLKTQLQDELRQQGEFVEFLVRRAQHNNPAVSEEKCRQFVQSCVDWWKTKNIWKRPISKNDALAMKMIERRVNAKVNKKKLI